MDNASGKAEGELRHEVKREVNNNADALPEDRHQTAQSVRDQAGPDTITMRQYNALQLPPLRSYSSVDIRCLRLRCKASQAAFAAYLNICTSTIQKWEQGQKRPSGTAVKLLNMIERKGLDALG